MPDAQTASGCILPRSVQMKTRPVPAVDGTRERVVTVMLSNEEKAKMTAKAKRKGLRLAPWLRMLGLNDLEKGD